MTNAMMLYYDDRQMYVEGLRIGLCALREFDGIEYFRKALTGEEFVKISDLTGSSMFLDITKMTKAEILKDVAKVLLMGDIDDSRIIPMSFISDKEKMLDVAELFRRA